MTDPQCDGARREDYNRDGLWWYKAPLPRRLHRCTTWSRDWGGRSVIHRCACGAISRDGANWTDRNSRRKWGWT